MIEGDLEFGFPRGQSGLCGFRGAGKNCCVQLSLSSTAYEVVQSSVRTQALNARIIRPQGPPHSGSSGEPWSAVLVEESGDERDSTVQ